MVFMVLKNKRVYMSDESDQRKLELCKNMIRLHKIYHVRVGTPFPNCAS